MQPGGPSRNSPEVVAREITDRLRTALGTTVRSVLAHGSWVHGDFRPGRSDLDLLVLLADEPDADLVARVEPVLDRVVADRPRWSGHLELLFVTRATVVAVLGGDTGRRAARISPGEPLHLVDAERHRVLDWDSARRGVSLWGAAPAEAIPPIPDRMVREVVAEHLRAWPQWLAESDSVGFRAYAVLTVSRAAAYLATGRHRSKREAARWATGVYPESLALVEWAARWWYEQGSDDEKAPDGVGRYVETVAAAAR